jgi:hypothetical protein
MAARLNSGTARRNKPCLLATGISVRDSSGTLIEGNRAMKEHLLSRGIDHRIRWAANPGMSFLKTESPKSRPPWMEASNWSMKGALWISWLGQVVDIVVALGIVAAHRLHQVRMRCLHRHPNKRTYEMISFYLLGWASLNKLETHIKKLKQKPA